MKRGAPALGRESEPSLHLDGGAERDEEGGILGRNRPPDLARIRGGLLPVAQDLGAAREPPDGVEILRVHAGRPLVFLDGGLTAREVSGGQLVANDSDEISGEEVRGGEDEG